VVDQETSAAFEVIVAASGDDGTADVVRDAFPEVIVVDVPDPGLPGAARNAGLAVATGEIVSFPGSHVELPPGSLEARTRAHELGFSMVTGSIHNGRPTRPGWAGYFLDHSTALPGRPSGELDAPPAHCSYAREALLQAGGFPEDMRAGEDTVVNRALWRRGHRAYRSQEIVLTHRNPCSSPWALARHHFVRGRALGTILLAERTRVQALTFLRGYPLRRVRTMDENVRRWGGGLRQHYKDSRRLVLLGAWAAAAGATFEVLTGERGRAGHETESAGSAPPPALRDMYGRG
jgi:glycosyltransferase involved in cell wall biosynthesis